MKFWLSLVSVRESEQLPELARYAEKLGFHGLMIGDLFVATPNVIIVPSALFIMFRAMQSHHRYGKTTDATAVPAR